MKDGLIPPGLTSVIYSLTDNGIPCIPVMGINNISSTSSSLVEHCHPGIMEIRYLKTGQLTWNVDGNDYIQKGNEFFITFPGEMHCTSGYPICRGQIYWLQVQFPTTFHSFLGLTAERAEPIVQGLMNLPRRSFPGKRMARPLFEKIIHLHQQNFRGDILQSLSIAARLQAWLLLVIECAHTQEETREISDSQAKMNELIDLIRKNPGERYNSNEMADMLGLSSSRFFHKFKDAMGMTPGEFILRAKVERARALLTETNMSITDISFRLGFSSSQYFATVFKRYTRITPRQARKERLPPF
ncbi:MAG: AraC family transcriptional regulator [bacterium]|nr:AraC family transcriptional regulator [bacterium]